MDKVIPFLKVPPWPLPPTLKHLCVMAINLLATIFHSQFWHREGTRPLLRINFPTCYEQLSHTSTQVHPPLTIHEMTHMVKEPTTQIPCSVCASSVPKCHDCKNEGSHWDNLSSSRLGYMNYGHYEIVYM